MCPVEYANEHLMAKIADSLKLSESEIDELMQRETRIRIATIGPGAEINLTPMTFGWTHGLVYIFGRGQKIVNVRRNSTATILVDVGSAWQELKGIMMRGRAKILENKTDESADPWLREAQLNLGRKSGLIKDGEVQPYAASASGNTRRWIVFQPTSVVSWDNARLG
jgi:nitroimidazol reductase NimA-like FMN-containing flavoprotein (pyridoxamine 5'-phosphate oxidase superfamily)